MDATEYVIERIDEAIAHEGSLRKAAEAMGISASILSRIKNRKYGTYGIVSESFMKRHFPEGRYQTNGDRFRKKSDEELANILAGLDDCPDSESERECDNNCIQCWFKWLKKV